LAKSRTGFNDRDYERFLECVHCGLCLSSCPTYTELGNEADSPRGRVHFMKAVADGRLAFSPKISRHIDLCLGCVGCESNCPSGIHYGLLVEKARALVEEQSPRPWQDRALRKFMAALLPHPGRLDLALLPVRMLRAIGLGGLLEGKLIRSLLPGKFRPMLSLIPKNLPPFGDRNKLGTVIPAQGERKHRVAMLTGCVMSVMFSRTNDATARILARNGCEVVIPKGQVCCGALQVHMGDPEGGQALARKNVLAFAAEDVDAIVINAAGCGATMKDYGELLVDDPDLGETAKAVAGKCRDISEFLTAIDLDTDFGEVRARAAYHDACHLAHAQKITSEPRTLLEQIPGLELVPLKESDTCCGSAGPYNLFEPEMASRLLKRKVRNIKETGADIVISGNPGCNLQIAAGLREEGLDHIEVLHTIDLLDRAYQAAGR